MKELSRRRFLSAIGVRAASLPLFSFNSATFLSSQDIPGMKLGYSAITWGGDDRQAIKDVSSLGFSGIQLRSNILKEFGNNPEAVRDLLKQYNLEFPMFSSGNANINTGNDEDVIQTHLNNAKFVKAVGGKYIQLTNTSRPRSGSPSNADLKKYGSLINEIGKRTQDIGIQATYHNHMDQLGETPEEVDIILDNCDESNVKLLLDIAHYFQGGGDPVQALLKYKDRISTLHLKDVKPSTSGGRRSYKFVELGQGIVNLPDFFKTLQQINFKGWGIVELDAVPDKIKTPLQCGEISRAYLKSLGIKI